MAFKLPKFLPSVEDFANNRTKLTMAVSCFRYLILVLVFETAYYTSITQFGDHDVFKPAETLAFIRELDSTLLYGIGIILGIFGAGNVGATWVNNKWARPSSDEKEAGEQPPRPDNPDAQ
jgi:hypothetical protein